jgi:hypothetical protein
MVVTTRVSVPSQAPAQCCPGVSSLTEQQSWVWDDPKDIHDQVQAEGTEVLKGCSTVGLSHKSASYIEQADKET